MSFRTYPGPLGGPDRTWEADWGAFEGTNPNVIAGWHVTYHGGNHKKGYVQYDMIAIASKMNPDGSFDSRRMWLGPLSEEGVTPKDSTSPFNYPFYPDTRQPKSKEYPIAIVEYEECTPMDLVVLHVAVAESDSNTAATVVGVLTTVAGLVITALGLAGTIPSGGTAVGVASLGAGIVSLGYSLLATDGDENFGEASDAKNSPGRYTLKTANGPDGSVFLDWAIESKVVEKNSPDCADGGKKVSLRTPTFDPLGEQALAHFGSIRDLISQIPENNSTLVSAVMQTVNSTQYQAMARMENDNALSLTMKAEELYLAGNYRDSLELYESAFLATIGNATKDIMSSSHASVSVVGVESQNARVIDFTLYNQGESAMNTVVVRNVGGNLDFVKAKGWERMRIGGDSALLWTDQPLEPGSSVSVLAVATSLSDFSFRVGSESRMIPVPISYGSEAGRLTAAISNAIAVDLSALEPIRIRVIDSSSGDPIANATLLFSRMSEVVSEVMTDSDGRVELGLGGGNFIIAIGANNYVNTAQTVNLDASGEHTLELLPLLVDGKMSAIVFSDHVVTMDQLVLSTGPECRSGEVEAPHWNALDSTVMASDGTMLEDPDPSGCGFGKASEAEVVLVENPVESESQVVISANITEASFDHVIDSSPCPQGFATINLTASQSGTWTLANAPIWLTVTIDRNIASIEFNCNVEEFVPQSLNGTIDLTFRTTQGTVAGSVPVAVAGRLLAQQ
jgi:hypothetical protein